MNKYFNEIMKNVSKLEWEHIITIEGKFYYLKRICKENNIPDDCITDGVPKIKGTQKTDHVREFERIKKIANLVSDYLDNK